jgi:hypothetical protein
MKLLIIGHARHGKDTVAEMISELTGMSFMSSSVASSEIFLYDLLKDKYGYNSPLECFEDRVNHRAEWYDLICAFNQADPTRLAQELLSRSDIYVGVRSEREATACINAGLFDVVLGVYDPRKPLEPESSFTIDMWAIADIVIPNTGTLEDLRRKVSKVTRTLNSK